MKELFTITTGSNVAKAKSAPTKGLDLQTDQDASSNPKDFFSVMFANIKESLKSSEESSKQNSENILTQTGKTDILKNGDTEAKSLSDFMLKDVLEIVSILKNSDETKPLFPNYSNKLDKLLLQESVLKEFKDVKNLKELFALSKKYDLGLEKLDVKQLDMKQLKEEFPKLDKSFFTLPKSEVKSETPTQVNPKNENLKSEPKAVEVKPSETVLKDIQKTTSPKEAKEPSLFEKMIQPKKDESSDKTAVHVSKEISKEAPKETLNVKAEAKEAPKEIKSTQQQANIETPKETTKEVLTTKLANATQEAKNTLNQSSEHALNKEVIKEKIENTLKVAPNEVKKSTSSKESNAKDDEAKIDKLIQTLENTRVAEPKVQNQSPQKGFVENILQNLKQEKPLAANLANASKEEMMRSSEKLANESSSEVKQDNKIEAKVDTNIRASDIKTRSENIQNRQALPTRETFNSFANDLRERIENYKPPLMKIQMALNPKTLGEVDVTIINRGSNLHVNITSNTTTMTLFTQNQAEFKNSLVNMGFTNLEMNFSDQRDGQQHNQTSKDSSGSSAEEYFEENLDDEGTQEVELIVPQYV